MCLLTELFTGTAQPVAFGYFSDTITGLMYTYIAQIAEHHFVAVFPIRTATDVTNDMIVVFDAHLTGLYISGALLFQLVNTLFQLIITNLWCVIALRHRFQIT